MNNRINRKPLLVLLALPLIILACSGCDKENEVGAPSKHLLIYQDSATKTMVQKIVGVYQVHHKDVEVEIVDLSGYSEQEYMTKISAELMSGNGPDLVFLDERFMQSRDVYKMMDAGAFEDLTSYFEQRDFQWSGYVKTVMDAGVWKERRLIVPLQYDLPLLVTGKQVLAETGFDLGTLDNGLDFMREAVRFSKRWQSGESEITVFGDSERLEDYFEMMGIDPFDYGGKKLRLDDPTLREAAEQSREFYPEDSRDATPVKDETGRWNEQKIRKERTHGCVFESYLYYAYPLEIMFDVSLLQSFDEPILLPFKGVDGRMQAKITLAVAMNQQSGQKQEAFDLLEIALNSYQANLSDDGFTVQKGTAYAKNIYPYLYANPRALSAESMMVWNIGNSYIDRFGQEVLLDCKIDCKSITDEFAEEAQKMTEEVEAAYFPTPYRRELYRCLLPYFKGEASLDSCLNTYRTKYQIYLSE